MIENLTTLPKIQDMEVPQRKFDKPRYYKLSRASATDIKSVDIIVSTLNEALSKQGWSIIAEKTVDAQHSKSTPPSPTERSML